MKKQSSKLMVSAIVAGLVAGGTAIANKAFAEDAAQPTADKASCKGEKASCKGEKAAKGAKHKKDKSSCSGKSGCKGEAADKAADKAPETK